MIRVLIADDHRIARHAISRILEAAGDIVVVGEAGSNQEVLQAIHRFPVDVLLLDIVMPDGKGLDILEQLHLRKPELKVLILTMYPNKEFITQAMRLHAYGFLTKESAPEELVTAIRNVARGEIHITPTLGNRPERKETSVHEVLSKREFEILRMLAAGRSPTEIGRELSISIKTVSTYRARIMAKLQLKNTAEIIRYALVHGLTE